MNVHTTSKTSRREFLRLSAGAMIALGLAPGCARFRDAGQGDAPFTFVVINDGHFSTPECPAFFERVRKSIRTNARDAELCLFVGDLSDNGTTKELGAMRSVLKSFHKPWHAVIGNHDYATNGDRAEWDKVLPGSLNYRFEHRGWQFVGLDSTELRKADKTMIQPHTLAWVKENAPRLDRKKPTIIFTHFPLGPKAPKRPVNADELLTPFLDCNLVQVFGGHHHGFTRQDTKDTVFVTNKCCSISKPNHDKTTEKGYFLCTASENMVTWEFIEVPVT